MATWYARQTANINAANVWNAAPDGSGAWLTWPPAASDVLLANNFTVTVNVSTTVAEVRNDNTGGATAGGSFTLANGAVLMGNVYSGTAGTRCVTLTGTNSATIVGQIQSGATTAVDMTSSGTLTVTGNVTGGTAANARGINQATAAGTITITGDVTGGTNSSAVGVNSAIAGTITLTGNSIGATAIGLSNTVGGSASISGYVQASATAAGANNTAQGTFTVGETRSASNGRPAVTGAFRYASATAAKDTAYTQDGTQIVLSPTASIVPAVETVRKGVTYGDGAYTGTLDLGKRNTSMAGRF